MRSTEHWLVHNHTKFEQLIRECRDAADISDWWALEKKFRNLVELLHYHMAQEEEVLFPAYEEKRKHEHKSTQELYNEHSVIVNCLRNLDKLIDSQSSQLAHTCLVSLEQLMIEHNKKEEQTFLPFASHMLFEDRDELVLKLKNFVLTNRSRRWNIKHTN